ncbi:CatB-related O-acetyltransferase [Antarcticimicrobium luteum]|uniref:CatB-related O-acetyltransferase n=1 Tax=Antarcticimicrobium luteum TaxID=2547397 RepID=A0A4R5VGT9_9RHOB|nr:CatB-related O-acetyltransferase [Antarcticimicrobium luteum]TDK52668.1 CatB-related O-acetyltransferase [Antarcticimicrobium luteum]
MPDIPTPDFPTPDTRHPVRLPDGSRHPGTVFLRSAVDHPRWEVGEYSYASAFDPPADWAAHLAPYLFDFSPERLVIGRFCQIADGVRFITASANHRYDGFSSFPFAIFDGPTPGRPSLPQGPGPDTRIGHDVWIGQGARILPGARLGSGVIVGAGAVVTGEVPPYAVVAGNPARVVRMRFDAATVARLLVLAWWDWPIDRIRAAEAAICGADLDALERAAP